MQIKLTSGRLDLLDPTPRPWLDSRQLTFIFEWAHLISALKCKVILISRLSDLSNSIKICLYDPNRSVVFSFVLFTGPTMSISHLRRSCQECNEVVTYLGELKLAEHFSHTWQNIRKHSAKYERSEIFVHVSIQRLSPRTLLWLWLSSQK